MSANALGRRVRTDSDAFTDLPSEATCAWIDIGIETHRLQKLELN